MFECNRGDKKNTFFEEMKYDDMKVSILDIKYLKRLKKNFNKSLYKSGAGNMFYQDLFDFYKIKFDFDIEEREPNIKSIIIIASFQPPVNIQFDIKGEKKIIPLPPTYRHHTDSSAGKKLKKFLMKNNYSQWSAQLPLKLLAVHSGLAKYGLNNIAYIDEWGSNFRLTAWFSDIECEDDSWQDLSFMSKCSDCRGCLKACPTSAINEDGSIIKANMCLTYFNERPKNFPSWLKKEWHNSIIGCMKCQQKCQLNKAVKNIKKPAFEFNNYETELIFNGEDFENLDETTQLKLKDLYLVEDYKLLHRNLKELV